MSFIIWVATLGMVLLVLAPDVFLSALDTGDTAVVCLGLGNCLGPAGLGLLQLPISSSRGWMEHLTEAAVLFSLFVSGLKLRLPLHHQRWKIAFLLAGPVMLLCIGGVTLLLHYGMDLGWGVSVLIGAILAPTDPVLATLVQVNVIGLRWRAFRFVRRGRP